MQVSTEVTKPQASGRLAGHALYMAVPARKRCQTSRSMRRSFPLRLPRLEVDIEHTLVVVVELREPSVGQHRAVIRTCDHRRCCGWNRQGYSSSGRCTLRSRTVSACTAIAGRSVDCGVDRGRRRLRRSFLRRLPDALEGALKLGCGILRATLHGLLADVGRGRGRPRPTGLGTNRLRRFVRRLADALEGALELRGRRLAFVPQQLPPLDVLLDLARELGVVSVKQLAPKVQALLELRTWSISCLKLRCSRSRPCSSLSDGCALALRPS